MSEEVCDIANMSETYVTDLLSHQGAQESLQHTPSETRVSCLFNTLHQRQESLVSSTHSIKSLFNTETRVSCLFNTLQQRQESLVSSTHSIFCPTPHCAFSVWRACVTRVACKRISAVAVSRRGEAERERLKAMSRQHQDGQ